MKNYEGEFNNINKNLENTAKETNSIYDKMYDKILSGKRELVDNVNNIENKRTEYENLMAKKRYTTLSKYEKASARLLKENIDYFDDLRQKEFENLENQYKLQNISAEEYYTGIAVLRDTFFKEGSSQWAEYTIKILNYNKNVLDTQKKELMNVFSEIDEQYEDSFKRIIKKQDDMSKKMMGISDIYSKVSINGNGENQTYTWLQLSNIDAEIDAMKKYNESLLGAKDRVGEMLSKLGLDDKQLLKIKSEFFSQLTDLNFGEGIGFSNYLMNISDEKLGQYLKKWVEKVNLSEMIANNLYDDESRALIEQYSSDIGMAISNELAEGIATVPESFYNNGALACTEFKNGFLSALDSVVSDISLEINKKINALGLGQTYPVTSNSVTNNSNYNIYETSSPQMTALAIYKQEALKRMLTGN